MEHLDREEEDEEGGEANANARNKAINSLLKGPKPQNHNHSDYTAPVETDDEESEEEDPPAVRTEHCPFSSSAINSFGKLFIVINMFYLFKGDNEHG